MSRNTHVEPEEINDPLLQAQLNKFWDLIEDKYEDEWRVEYSGAMTLLVDGPMLERIFTENFKETTLGYSEELKGLYSITGVYSNYYTLVDGPREYFFEQGY